MVSDNRDMNIYEEYTSYTFYRFDNWTVQITLQTPMIEGIVTLSMYLYREGMTTIAKKVDVQVCLGEYQTRSYMSVYREDMTISLLM